jgi:hypothetical protein
MVSQGSNSFEQFSQMTPTSLNQPDNEDEYDAEE